jgi:hypothetical protein
VDRTKGLFEELARRPLGMQVNTTEHRIYSSVNPVHFCNTFESRIFFESPRFPTGKPFMLRAPQPSRPLPPANRERCSRAALPHWGALELDVKGQRAMMFIAIFPMTSLVGVVVLVLLATAAAYDNGLAALPPMGWNTWCTDDLCGMTLQQRL